jgi:hypothetical protein
MIECHGGLGESLAAVGAHRTVLLEEPSPRFGVGDSSRGMRRELERAMRCAALGALLSASSRPSAASAGPGGALSLERFLRNPGISADACGGGTYCSPMLVRRAARGAALLGPFVAIGRIVELSGQTWYD